MAEIIINKGRYECAPAVASYINQLERNNLNLQEEFFKQGAKIDELKAENAQLEESFQRVTGEITADPLPRETVDRKCFNDAANEIGDSIEDGNDKMAIAVFVNNLEERLFGSAEEIDTNKLLNKQKEKMKGAIKISHPDYETGHEMADDILCETLTLLGFGELVTLFKDVTRMYSF